LINVRSAVNHFTKRKSSARECVVRQNTSWNFIYFHNKFTNLRCCLRLR